MSLHGSWLPPRVTVCNCYVVFSFPHHTVWLTLNIAAVLVLRSAIFWHRVWRQLSVWLPLPSALVFLELHRHFWVIHPPARSVKHLWLNPTLVCALSNTFYDVSWRSMFCSLLSPCCHTVPNFSLCDNNRHLAIAARHSALFAQTEWLLKDLIPLSLMKLPHCWFDAFLWWSARHHWISY